MRKRVFKMWANTNEGYLALYGHYKEPITYSTRQEAESCQEEGDLTQRVKVTIEPIGKPRKPKEWFGL